MAWSLAFRQPAEVGAPCSFIVVAVVAADSNRLQPSAAE